MLKTAQNPLRPLFQFNFNYFWETYSTSWQLFVTKSIVQGKDWPQPIHWDQDKVQDLELVFDQKLRQFLFAKKLTLSVACDFRAYPIRPLHPLNHYQDIKKSRSRLGLRQ